MHQEHLSKYFREESARKKKNRVGKRPAPAPVEHLQVNLPRQTGTVRRTLVSPKTGESVEYDVPVFSGPRG